MGFLDHDMSDTQRHHTSTGPAAYLIDHTQGSAYCIDPDGHPATADLLQVPLDADDSQPIWGDAGAVDMGRGVDDADLPRMHRIIDAARILAALPPAGMQCGQMLDLGPQTTGEHVVDVTARVSSSHTLDYARGAWSRAVAERPDLSDVQVSSGTTCTSVYPISGDSYETVSAVADSSGVLAIIEHASGPGGGRVWAQHTALSDDAIDAIIATADAAIHLQGVRLGLH
jgi:hypothetical protein